MSNAIRQPWEDQIDLIKRTVAAGANADEFELFLYQARRTGLDPLARQIHYVKRGGRGTVQVGIDGFRLIADRSGTYAGSDDAVFSGNSEGGFPAKATVTVYKMVSGQRCPFSASARWDEYYPGDSQGFQWRKMPHTMLAKCAEALALRKAYPADMSGLYVHEEMEQADRPAPEPVLEGNALHLTAKEVLSEPKGAVAPDDKNAFGYVPVRWPLDKMFKEAATESQRKMMASKARERTIEEEDFPIVRRLVLESYGIEDAPTKGAATLFIDWLINAEEEHIDAAVTAAEEVREAMTQGVNE